MENEYIEEINKILSTKEIDKREKELIKLYFIGKLKSGKITIQELQQQTETLCKRAPKVEFINGKITSAYTKEIGLITINKKLLLDGKAEDVIVPTFMKFESALNQENRRDYANHIEDFLQAGEIAKACEAPISDRLYKLHEMAQYVYGDSMSKVDELSRDGVWKGVCFVYNFGLNNVVTSGKSDMKPLFNSVYMFNGEIYTPRDVIESGAIGPFNNPEYQKRSARIISILEQTQDLTDSDKKELDKQISGIQENTGCTREMIEHAKEIVVHTNEDLEQYKEAVVHTNKDLEQYNETAMHTNEEKSTYTYNKKITDVLQRIMIDTKTEINEEIIVSKVQEVLNRKPEWDSKIKHLVIPFFIRSQKIYNWSFDEFQERLNQVDSKIRSIAFKPLENIDILGVTALDVIKLNSKVFLNKNGKPIRPVSPALFHELGHITDENMREGILSKDRIDITPNVETGLYEWMNTIFERVVTGEKLYKKKDAMELTESGYDALGPLGSMLSCALGVSELEFMYIKDRGSEYEEKLLQRIFPNGEGRESYHKIRQNFDKYNLDTYLSFKKKKSNQKIANEIYTECLNLMKKRIDIERASRNDETIDKLEVQNQSDEQYRKHQMFLLKKLNYNFKTACQKEGLIFLRSPIVHDIGYCTDNLKRRYVLEIANGYQEMANFGFNNNNLGKYSKAIATNNDKKQQFSKSLSVPDDKPNPTRHDNPEKRGIEQGITQEKIAKKEVPDQDSDRTE